MRRKQRTSAEQLRLITECYQSGLTVFRWCQQNDVKISTFYAWVNRLRQRGEIDIPAIIPTVMPRHLDSKSRSLFLFCGCRCDRIKALIWEGDGYVLLYKRLDVANGRYRWPRNKSEARNLTWQQFDWLMSGIDIEQPTAIRARQP